MKTTRFIILAILTVAALRAAPQKLTRGEAVELYGALNSIAPGLNPANVSTAADDITALYPVAKAFDLARDAKQRVIKSLAKDPDRDAKAQAVLDELLAVQNSEITVELTAFTISDDELTAAKPAPATLAVIRRLLHAPPKK